MKKKSQTLFDSIPEQSKKSKEMAVLRLPDKISAMVDDLGKRMTQLKTDKSAAEDSKKTLRAMVTPLHEAACKESYQGSVRLVGDTYDLSMVRKNAFSIDPEVTMDKLTAKLGSRFTENNFEQQVTLNIRPEAIEDSKKRATLFNKLNRVFTPEEIGIYFEKITSITTKGNLEEAQFDLSDRRYAALRTMVTQANATISLKKK